MWASTADRGGLVRGITVSVEDVIGAFRLYWVNVWSSVVVVCISALFGLDRSLTYFMSANLFWETYVLPIFR